MLQSYIAYASKIKFYHIHDQIKIYKTNPMPEADNGEVITNA